MTGSRAGTVEFGREARNSGVANGCFSSIREARFQAALPEIRQFLIPLTTPGHRQLQGDEWVSSDKKVPLSLNGIRAKDALSNDPLGFEQMDWIGGGRDNDRPNGPVRHDIGGAIHP